LNGCQGKKIRIHVVGWLVGLADMTMPGIYPTPGKVPDFPFFSSSLSADCT